MTSDFCTVDFDPPLDGDSPVLLGQLPEGGEINTVATDGANDTHLCHETVIERDVTHRS